MQCISFPQLDESQVEKLQELEDELGTLVLAVGQECHWAELDEEQLRKLQSAENELGVTLLAYASE